MAYNQEQRLKIAGLWISPNSFSEVPEGALQRATNVNLLRDSVLSTRRGFRQYGNPVAASGNVLSIFPYDDGLIVWTDLNELKYDANYDGTLWTQYPGSYEVPDNTTVGSRIRATGANKNFYFTTKEGVFKLDRLTATPIPAGAPAALGGSGTTTGSSGFMANDTAVAYKVVWGYRDANDNLIQGAPSDRIIVTNTAGGDRDVLLTFTVPYSAYIDTSWFYQVYRSDPSATAADAPNDDYQQVYEGNPSSGELSSRLVTITDVTPDELRQAFLYTSANQEGAIAANYTPPYCKDICSYRNFTFFANTREPHFYDNTLLSVGASTGLQVGDTITFTSGVYSFTLTGAAVEDVAAGEFEVYTSGTPEENNEITARSIVNVINLYSLNNFLDANYASGFDDLAGQMTFTKRTIDTANFYMNSSRTTCWSPAIPATGSNSANTSINNAYFNRIYYSKQQQPEAVPLLNFFDIGSAHEPIVRIISLRDSVMILKTDGVYSITGDDPSNFRVSTLDNTSIIVAPNSAVAFNNKVFFFGQRGIIAVGPDGSSEIKSTPIKKELLTLSTSVYPNFPELTYGISYESDAQYILPTVLTPDDDVCVQEYVYNDETSSPGLEAWTRWDRQMYCGVVNPADNKLYTGGKETADGCYVYQERKELNNSDFADEEYEVDITDQNGLVLTLTDVSNVTQDMTLVQGDIQSIVESVDTNNNTITVSDLFEWTLGPATVFTPINTIVRTNQLFAGGPGMLKHIAETSFFFEEPNFDDIAITFISDYVGDGEIIYAKPVRGGGWGTFPWGTLPWGGSAANTQRIRVGMPKKVQRVNWLMIQLETKQCFVSFSLVGMATVFTTVSQRQKN